MTGERIRDKIAASKAKGLWMGGRPPLGYDGVGRKLIYTYDTRGEHTGITDLLDEMRNAGVAFKDLSTTQSSLEDIFVGLVSNRK